MHLFKVNLTLTADILGTAPANKELYEKYIASKKAEAEEKRVAFARRAGTMAEPPVGTVEEEIETIDENAGLTVFHRDAGGLFLYQYMLKGFLKEAAEILVDEHGIKQPRSKLDNYLFVEPRQVYILGANGKPILEPDGRIERPLRAMTMQGPRVSLVASEFVKAGRTLEFFVKVYPHLKSGSGREAKLVQVPELLERLLNYGADKGLGQWRNAGNGTFTFKMEVMS